MSLVTLVSKSFKTIIEMLADRNYPISIDKNALHERLEDDFNKTTFNIILPNHIHIIYHMGTKFKYSEIKKFLEEADEANAQLVILVVNDSVTSSNMKQLAVHKVPREIHNVKTLQINISKHTLVPRHEVITDQSVIDKILEEFSLKSKHQLPIILKTDAMAKYLGLKSGDVVKITRPSPTAGIYEVYRVCV